ncbi:glycoside hydrolase family 43 [Thermoclostridium stercorarium subsp. stercorarium DSM 8532]|uniref:Glycoside hydrolase family 43 n=4 Tax=Thermoclostridium stercorarium TaxID=1510 RepID=L7VNS7_THES1|nr:glycoside hydrolase family 43 protein [Thermoclostridium stercorarium]AGC68111.1 glycoside hydrolase family 43 [Thermoclostridium stercorarium subsp. stercorarium DSM 8532]AGI39137.1 beta-xylosidase [Thermoclostridium stercorarium subsp. stercorarium DSM 8532]ANW98492.1 endo-alpha-(1->5)-L-arabinanase [Thermoclostridium stercorarium subsp. thermolacticum DSM 2910]ANX01026.1 endo-alpha-(1->5)-L-arabinanase [Thermoclostridium stercorarium subsp. leptospartum DSM 9219]
MRKKIIFMLAVGALLLTAACGKRTAGNEVPAETKDNRAQPTGTESNDSDTGGIVIGRDVKLTADNPINYSFANVSVHDPSIVEDNGTYYIFGSHLAAAKSKDLMNWELIGSGVNASNPIIPNALEEMREAFEWSKTNTFWAPDVIRLKNGKYYMYYCTCEGSSPLSALGVAVSDDIEGPYRDLGIILKSGMGYDMPSEDGNMYNANVHPNVVDPCLFYDTEGRLWMVYGSYSGGIYILEMDPETGFPLNKGYGKKILGGNHARIEGPFVLYSPETGYYYLFLSFGGLDSKGGYNIRVARSKNPDGPYYDASGNDMINCKGAPGTFFHDPSIEGYGVKLMGGHRFAWIEGEQSKIRFGYLSPGHNSAYYDEKTGKYFLIFHTRFEGRGEVHEVRVHQFFINEDGWPVVAPYRYTGETLGTYTKEQVTGIYKYINHGKSINREAIVSELIQLNEDYTITGAVKGTWKLKDDGRSVEIVIGEEVYKGVFVMQWDEYGKKNVMTFTALSDTGVAIWGSGIWAIE